MPGIPAFPAGGGWLEVKKDVRFRGKLEYPEAFPWNTHHVEYTNGSDNNSGVDKDHAFSSLAQAVSVAEPWDRILVHPAYDAAAMLESDDDLPIIITQNGLKIIGGMTNERQWGTPAIHSHGTATLIEIDAHQVEIAYLGFHMQGAGGCIDVAHSGDYWRNHIHHCYFGGNATALWGIIAGNVTGSGFGHAHTVDAPCTVIEDNYFTFFNGSCVYANCGYGSVLRRNSFFVQAGDVGVTVGNNSTSRPHLEILDNRFSTPDSSSAYGIKVPNTPSAGYFFVDGNRFVNFADDDHCCEKRTGYTGLNYLGVTVVSITT